MNIKDEKYLLFLLKKEHYGIPILRVNEIIGMTEIIPIPASPHYMKGIINLRGRIIPVIELRTKFGMPDKEPDEQTCIIIVERPVDNNVALVGLLVDKVAEVVTVYGKDVDYPPQYGQEGAQSYWSGVGKVKDEVVMLLDIDAILTKQDIVAISKDARM